MVVKVTPVTPLECSVKVMKQKPLRVFHTLTCGGGGGGVRNRWALAEACSLSHTHKPRVGTEAPGDHLPAPCLLPLPPCEGGLGDCVWGVLCHPRRCSEHSLTSEGAVGPTRPSVEQLHEGA